MIKNNDNGELTHEQRIKLRERDFERLKIMTYYCTTSGCLREYILRYFGESTGTYCGKCSNCLGKFKQTDVTGIAKLIISCINELDTNYGITMLIAILTGDENERIRSKGLNRLKSYAAAADKSKTELRTVIDYLLAEGCLVKSNGDYPVISASSKCGEIMRGDAVVNINMPAEEKSQQKIERSLHTSNMDASLFEQLKKVRMDIAIAAHMPAFVVFSDAVLHELAVHKPKTEEEMLGISGIGEYKLKKYGKRFLDVIREY